MTIIRSAFILGLIALFLSFSRTAWIAGAVSLIALLLFLAKNKIKALGILSTVFLVGFMTTGNIVASRLQTLVNVDQQSLVVRQQLNVASLKMISDHPLLGVGLNNFLIALPQYYQLKNITRFYQPAHNIYLMMAAETGLVGLIIFIIFIAITIRHIIRTKHYLLLLLITELLFLGLFDHYLYTLQQGQLLAALVFGLAWSKKAKYN